MAISTWRLAAFTAPSLPIAGVGLPLIVHLPPYYAGALGLDLAVVGLIFVIVRVLDLPLDLLFGRLLDRTHSRFGRFRPWFLAGAASMFCAVGFVFMAEPGISPLAAFLGLFVLFAGVSLFMLSHVAWAATLSRTYDDRSRIFGWIQSVAMLGMLVILALPAVASRILGTKTAAAGMHAMGLFVMLSLVASTILVLATVREGAQTTERPHHGRGDLERILRNPLMRRLLLIDVFAGLAPGVAASLYMFFFQHALDFDAGTASALMLPYFISGLVAAPLWMKLALRIGKHRAAAVAGITFCVTQTGIALLPAGNAMLAMPVVALAGTAFAAFPFLMRAMLADVLDVERLDSGRDCTGLFSATLMMTTKIAHALPVGLVYPLLALIGFQAAPDAVNTAGAMAGMIAIYVVLPAFLMIVAVAAVWRWPLDQQAHAGVLAALAARSDRAPAEDAPVPTLHPAGI